MVSLLIDVEIFNLFTTLHAKVEVSEKQLPILKIYIPH